MCFHLIVLHVHIITVHCLKNSFTVSVTQQPRNQKNAAKYNTWQNRRSLGIQETPQLLIQLGLTEVPEALECHVHSWSLHHNTMSKMTIYKNRQFRGGKEPWGLKCILNKWARGKEGLKAINKKKTSHQHVYM